MRGFWRFFYLVNYHPTDNGGGGGGGTSDGGDGGADDGADDGNDEDEGDGSDKPGKDDGKKLVPLDKHRKMSERAKAAEAERDTLKAEMAKLKKADEDKTRSEMSELEKLKADQAEITKKLQKAEDDKKKSDAILKAKRSLGKDAQLTAEQEAEIIDLVEGMAFDESRITKLVKGFASAKASSKSVAGNRSRADGAADKDPMSYNGKELGQLLKDDPDGYKVVMQARREKLAEKREENKRK